MIENFKYKINTAATDFGIAVKDVSAIIKEYTGADKKSGASLTETETNILFEVLTNKNAVKSFKAYFELGKAAREEVEKAKQAKKDQNLAAQMALFEQLKAAQEAEMAAKRAAEEAKKAPKEDPKKEEPKKAEPKAEPKMEEPQKAEPKAEAKKAPKAEAKAEVKKEHKPSDPKPFEARKKEDRPAGAAPNRGPAERRTVDTRFSNVDMEKYNEKYENIAPANAMKDNGARKQKINQKSQNYRRNEKSKKELEEEKRRRMQLEVIKKTPITVTVGDEITVGELAAAMKKTAAEVIKELMKLGMLAAVNQTIDYDTAEIVVTEMGAKIERAVVVTIEEQIMDETPDTEENLLPRSPVVVVMGHVDHGKTSLLDAIRNTAVTAGEAGGITQHIGAYRVNAQGQDITFLDTPGHAAFTSMRQRGAMATDIAILVVAADDGIMPQTIEAINHAKAANVQIIVAINKMDKPEANPDRIKQQLTEHSLVPEEWGGDIICVPVSAKTHAGIDDLLQNVLLVAEMSELKANPNRKAKGVVIEARLDKGRGPIATLLVQNGTLNTGDIIIAGTSVGRVRVMTNERGQKLKEAGPSVPVEIAGLTEVPTAGDTFDAVSNERLARELVEQRKQKIKDEAAKSANQVTLDNLFDKLGEGELKELKLIVKADVQGSVEAVKQSLEKLSNDEVRVKVIHGAAGGVNETDVMLAQTSGAIIVGFNVRPDSVAKAAAERDGVDMRLYRVIYDAIEEIESAMKGMLAPKYRDVEMGAIEVRNTFKISGVGTIAGGYVTEGKITRACNIRVVRDGVIIAEDKIDSLKRFKDDVKEVAQGYECGISLEKFADIKEGDIFEAYIVEEYRD